MSTEIEPQTQTRSRVQFGRLAVGALLILAGVGWLLDAAGILVFDWGLFLSAALIVVGAALLLVPDPRSRGALIPLGVILTILLGFGAGDPIRRVSRVTVGGGLGDKVERPREVDDIPSRYRLQFGELRIDLTDLDLSKGTTDVEASVGVGELEVIIPDNVDFSVSAQVGAGEIQMPDRTSSGADLEEDYKTGNFDQSDERLDLKLGAGFGEIRVRRVP